MLDMNICQAIEAKRLLELRYHNHVRLVEPYVHGQGKQGEEYLRCFQLLGDCVAGKHAGWKLLKITEVMIIHMLEIEFTPRWLEYKRGDRAMSIIYCQL